MNFDYSEDQKDLIRHARSVLTDHCATAPTRGVLDDAAVYHDERLWRILGEQGWLGTAIPAEYGGLGLGLDSLCALAEELGRFSVAVPFSSTAYFFTQALLRRGSDEQKRRLLPSVAAGRMIGAFASAEGLGVLSRDSLKTKVVNGRLSGVKIPVTDGSIADHAIVLAREDGTPNLFLVDLKSHGVARETLATLDPTRDAARLVFCDVEAERLGKCDGFAAQADIFDRAAVLLAFEQVGGADRCLDMAKDYALERYAFGRQIAGFQAIKHKLAEMFVRNEIARSNAYYGAWALASDAPDLSVAAATARISASEAFTFASSENIQTHGGIGFTWESDCHLLYRRARQLALVAGAPAVWRERLVTQLEQALV